MKPLNTAAQALMARALAGEQIPVAQLVYVGLPVPQRIAVCGIPLRWSGEDWTPLGIQISPIEDTTAEVTGLEFVFPGVSSSDIALALAEDVDGVPVRVYTAWVDPDTGVVADATLDWSGVLDHAQWQDGPEATVTFVAEHRGTVAIRPKVSRYTNTEQQRLYPGDTSLDIDPELDDPQVVWPAASFFRK